MGWKINFLKPLTTERNIRGICSLLAFAYTVPIAQIALLSNCRRAAASRRRPLQRPIISLRYETTILIFIWYNLKCIYPYDRKERTPSGAGGTGCGTARLVNIRYGSVTPLVMRSSTNTPRYA